jgi:hypothetical protein
MSRAVKVTHVLIATTVHAFSEYNEGSVDEIRRYEADPKNKDAFEILEAADSIEIITQVEELPEDGG